MFCNRLANIVLLSLELHILYLTFLMQAVVGDPCVRKDLRLAVLYDDRLTAVFFDVLAPLADGFPSCLTRNCSTPLLTRFRDLFVHMNLQLCDNIS